MHTFCSCKTLEKEIVSTNGNRYDVNLTQRTHTSVYWIDQLNEIRRSKWFYSNPKHPRFIPCDETMDESLEVKYTHIELFF
jgi:hypothetical protein